MFCWCYVTQLLYYSTPDKKVKRIFAIYFAKIKEIKTPNSFRNPVLVEISGIEPLTS